MIENLYASHTRKRNFYSIQLMKELILRKGNKSTPFVMIDQPLRCVFMVFETEDFNLYLA